MFVCCVRSAHQIINLEGNGQHEGVEWMQGREVPTANRPDRKIFIVSDQKDSSRSVNLNTFRTKINRDK